MIRAVVVDDEQRAREALMDLIGLYCEGVEVVGSADSVQAAIEAIDAKHPDLVFLDVEMPERNGFELLAAYSPPSFKVIFITAYDRYAVRAIKLSALDYLLKPVDPFELRAAVAKAVSPTGNAAVAARVELMRNQREVPTKVAIPTDDGYVFIELGNIIRCKSESNYTRIYLCDGSQILSSKTLGDYEDLLSEMNFFRVHHSHLVNIQHALRYRKGKGGSVVMVDGSEVEVSTRRKDAFLERIRKI